MMQWSISWRCRTNPPKNRLAFPLMLIGLFRKSHYASTGSLQGFLCHSTRFCQIGGWGWRSKWKKGDSITLIEEWLLIWVLGYEHGKASAWEVRQGKPAGEDMPMKPLVTCLTRELYMYLAQDLLIVTHVQKTKTIMISFAYTGEYLKVHVVHVK